MTDPIPVHDNLLAVTVGRVLHPFLLPIPTLLIILNGLPLGEVLSWLALITGMIVAPGAVATTLMDRYVNPVYKRRTRGPLFLVGWVSVLACLVVILRLNAPPVLIASVATLAVWVPLQWAINTWVTKISTHTAVATGCFTAIVVLGKASTPLIEALLVVLIMLTIWARVVTRHHTLPQVILGVLVGILPVLLVFPLVLV